MIVHNFNGKQYRIPSGLNTFQLELYVHLIDWKWRNVTKESGTAQGNEYDAVLPDSFKKTGSSPLIYYGVADALALHRKKNDFRIHTHYFHMASSQAAAINLFLPLLTQNNATAILRLIKPDFDSLAMDHLDQGFCLEFWGEYNQSGNLAQRNVGPLGDKSSMAGTDADIAIAYRNHQGELCLWLIEHKLTEKEFTECGGFKSKGRKEKHDCSRNFAEVLQEKGTCYYHDVRKFNYWNITERNQAFFTEHDQHVDCPFKGGMNQLWRNQLLGQAIEQDPAYPYQHVSFSVVKHPRNVALDSTLASYQKLIGNNPKFSVVQSDAFVCAAETQGDAQSSEWAKWYRELYNV